MQESFYTTQTISKEEMRALMQRSNHPAVFRYAFMYAAFMVMNVAVIYTWHQSFYLFAISQISYAVLCCSIFASLHETAHGTAFASKRLNKIAAFLAGFAHIYPSSLFRELHFAHHRFTHIPGKDPEISIGHRPAPSILLHLNLYLSWLTGLPLLLFKVLMLISGLLWMPEWIRKNLFPFVSPTKRKAIFIECFVFSIFYAALIFYGISENQSMAGILVGQILGHCLLAFYLSMEHNGLPHEGSILEKTRSINAHAFVKLVMWNMPYHAEHHAYPAIPFHALAQAHQRLEQELRHKDDTHFSFHKKAFSDLITGRAKKDTP